MARRRLISDETILEAARTIFTREGPGAPTSAIAKAVGVSEGTIFKRFATKEALVRASLRCPGSLWTGKTAERVGRTTIRNELEGLISELIAFFRAAVPRMVMLMSSGGLDPLALWRGPGRPPADTLHEGGPRFVIGELAAWAEAEMKLGRLSTRSPEIVARAIAAACHQFAFFELTGMGPASGEEDFIPEFAALLLEGIAGGPQSTHSTKDRP